MALPPSSGNTPLSSNAEALNVHSIASRVDPATVDITAKGANGQDEGTGMIITSSGVVLTNNHVIDGSTEVTAQIDGKGRFIRPPCSALMPRMTWPSSRSKARYFQDGRAG